MTKIRGVKNWYCSLEMRENFGMRPLLFLGGLWMVPVISWWALDGGTRSIHVLGVHAHANMQTCRHKKDQKSEAKKNANTRVCTQDPWN